MICLESNRQIQTQALWLQNPCLTLSHCNIFLWVLWNWNSVIITNISKFLTGFLLSGLFLSSLSHAQLPLWFIENETYSCHFLPHTFRGFSMFYRVRSKILSTASKSLSVQVPASYPSVPPSHIYIATIGNILCLLTHTPQSFILFLKHTSYFFSACMVLPHTTPKSLSIRETLPICLQESFSYQTFPCTRRISPRILFMTLCYSNNTSVGISH